jgi:chemotaxis protein histidine kinase CheA
VAQDLDGGDQRRLEVFRSLATDRLTRLNLSWIRFEQGEEPALREFLREIHTLKGEASLMGYVQIVAIAHAVEAQLRPLAAGGIPPPGDLGDRLLAALDLIGTALPLDAAATVPGLDALLADLAPGIATAVAQESGAAAARELTASGEVSPQRALAIGREHPLAAATAEASRPRRLLEGIRVSADRLDRLRDVVGELLLTRARIETSAAEFGKLREATADQRQRAAAQSLQRARELAVLLEIISGIESRLREDGHRVGRIVSELDSTTRELRMVRISTLYEQYPRAVRQMARELGRDARLQLRGDDVEVDRAVLDRLADPLLHLLRNAIDHGIEPPEVRRQGGKPSTGTIRISATVRGRLLELEVGDDGGGIDVEQVRARAVELGIVSAQSARTLDDEQVLRTLFSAGMSTRTEVTEVSGRGIGLNVVLNDIEALGGTVHLSAERGRGTTFRLTAPITTARSSMLVFQVQSGRYAVTSSSVVAVVDLETCERVDSVDGPCIRHRGALVPVAAVDEILGETRDGGGDGRSTRILIIHDGRDRLALTGSSRHVEEEVVLKPLGRVFEQQRLITAAAPLGDGSLALVLTVGELFQLARGAGTATARPRAAGTKPRRGKTVLVVDDSPVVRDLIAEALRSHGLRVLEAGDGQEALARLAVHAEVQLIITDLDMPKLDGIGLVKQVRGRPGPRLPIIVVTMRGSDDDKRAAIAAGADSYLVKNDLSHGGLWQVVERVLG